MWDEPNFDANYDYANDPLDLRGTLQGMSTVAPNNGDGLRLQWFQHCKIAAINFIVNQFDSEEEEISFVQIYHIFTRDQCEYLKDKPKLVFVDACRGRMLSKVESTKQNSSSKSNDTHNNNNSNNNDDVASQSSNSQITTKSPRFHADSDQTTEYKTSETTQENDKEKAKNKGKEKGDEKADENASKKRFENKLKEQAYHKEGNYRFIYTSIDGYAVVEGGINGGYLIRALHTVFSNVKTVLSSNLTDSIFQINEQAKTRVGTTIVAQQIEDVNRMNGPVRFKQKNVKQIESYVD